MNKSDNVPTFRGHFLGIAALVGTQIINGLIHTFYGENFTPVIPLSIVIGVSLVFVGVLLMRKRNQIVA